MSDSTSTARSAICAVIALAAFAGCSLSSPDEEACDRWDAYVVDWQAGLDSDGLMRARARNVGREASDAAVVEQAAAVTNSPTRHDNGPDAAAAVFAREVRLLSEACAEL